MPFIHAAGSYSHQASYLKFGDSVSYSPQTTISDVFQAVQSNIVTYGLVPFENSTYGSVQQTLDSFIQNAGAAVKIRADTFLPIHHCLLTNAPALSTIKRVYTHPEVMYPSVDFYERWFMFLL